MNVIYIASRSTNGALPALKEEHLFVYVETGV